MKINGIWIPVITPFLNGSVDYRSLGSLLKYYIGKKISGIIPLGTTGECPVIDEDEFQKIIEFTVETVENKVPVYVGLGSNYTAKTVKQLKSVSHIDFQGILSVCPYYSRPGQQGIYEHFRAVSESTDRKILIYNIPYRTGCNIENETLFRLAELENIIGVKDSCGDIRQSTELIFNKPEGFSVLTGEDVQFYNTLVLGGDGGILASAHIETDKFIEVFDLVMNNDHQGALEIWKQLAAIIPVLFSEPSPAPLKFLLKNKNMIQSDELRLPMTGISENLKEKLKSVNV
ncbi:MAG: 4-hydroxy-tetrahydrodipicolinate synthase [Spirochaetes bacterium]|nr:4-hydroxy-tetrahydrodipicolinate synthase [Spirochaetota bacterium]